MNVSKNHFLMRRKEEEYQVTAFESYSVRLLGKQCQGNEKLQEIGNGMSDTTIMHKMSPTHKNFGRLLQFAIGFVDLELVVVTKRFDQAKEGDLVGAEAIQCVLDAKCPL